MWTIVLASRAIKRTSFERMLIHQPLIQDHDQRPSKMIPIDKKNFWHLTKPFNVTLIDNENFQFLSNDKINLQQTAWCVFKIRWLFYSPTLMLVVWFEIFQAFSLSFVSLPKIRQRHSLVHIYSFSSNSKHCPSTICYDLKYGSRKTGNASL